MFVSWLVYYVVYVLVSKDYGGEWIFFSDNGG